MLLGGSRLPFSAIQLADQAIGSLPDSVQTWLDFHLGMTMSPNPQCFPPWSQVITGFHKCCLQPLRPRLALCSSRGV